MGDTTESSTETKKVVNPRAEIDTSPPFESVKEAVDRFGGSGPWIPHHLLRLAAAAHEDFDLENLEEHAAKLERDLILKEQETLNVLKELESAKRFVEGLKVNLSIAESSSSLMPSPDIKFENHFTENSTECLSFCPLMMSPNLMFIELNQAKLNLNKTSGDLAVIQASVESLNKKMRRDKLLLERSTKMQQIPNSEEIFSFEQNHCISKKVETKAGPDFSMAICKEANFEDEQFKKMTEASRYEVIKAMTEIERTKNSIRMAEMRLNAAKKMEEAAKAVEAIALAERKDRNLNSENASHGGITLSFEEYRVLTRKAQHAEDLCKTKYIDSNAMEVPILEKFEEIAKENTRSREVDLLKNVVAEHVPMQRSSENKFKFSNSSGHRSPPLVNGGSESCATKEKPMPGFRTTSIGDILGRKLILQDDVVVGQRAENRSEREHVSLSEMLREQSRLILHPHAPKAAEDGKVERQCFVQQKKKFGFMQMQIHTKQSKKKAQPLNLR